VQRLCRAPLQAKRLAAASGQAADKSAADKAAASADSKTARAGKRPELEAAAAPAPAKYVVRPRALPESTVEKVGRGWRRRPAPVLIRAMAKPAASLRPRAKVQPTRARTWLCLAACIIAGAPRAGAG
jgi:hypothetical protein